MDTIIAVFSLVVLLLSYEGLVSISKKVISGAQSREKIVAVVIVAVSAMAFLIIPYCVGLIFAMVSPNSFPVGNKISGIWLVGLLVMLVIGFCGVVLAAVLYNCYVMLLEHDIPKKIICKINGIYYTDGRWMSERR